MDEQFPTPHDAATEPVPQPSVPSTPGPSAEAPSIAVPSTEPVSPPAVPAETLSTEAVSPPAAPTETPPTESVPAPTTPAEASAPLPAPVWPPTVTPTFRPPGSPASATPSSATPSSAPGASIPPAATAPDPSGGVGRAAPAPAGPAPTAPTTPAPPTPTAPAPARPRSLALVGTAAVTALATSLATLGLTGAFAPAAKPLSVGTSGEATAVVAALSVPDWQQVAAAVRESVVAISVTSQFGGSEGSGVIIDAAGHILTNEHVVSGAADDGLRVTLADGRVLRASVVGTDPTTDLAVIALTDPPDDLSVATLGSSASVEVGAPVMAVGNPLGLDSTVTTGIVSATDRPVTTGRGDTTVVTNAIQIDAAVNPGNSGGPLFDAAGQVIGITSSIATTSSASGSIGLGFAIPVDLAARVAAELIETGSAAHAFLGVSLSDGTATVAGTTRRGAKVEEVVPGSPAATAGLAVGDVVVAIDGEPVSGATSLTGFVRARGVGDEVTLTVVSGGEERAVTVELTARS